MSNEIMGGGRTTGEIILDDEPAAQPVMSGGRPLKVVNDVLDVSGQTLNASSAQQPQASAPMSAPMPRMGEPIFDKPVFAKTKPAPKAAPKPAPRQTAPAMQGAGAPRTGAPIVDNRPAAKRYPLSAEQRNGLRQLANDNYQQLSAAMLPVMTGRRLVTPEAVELTKRGVATLGCACALMKSLDANAKDVDEDTLAKIDDMPVLAEKFRKIAT